MPGILSAQSGFSQQANNVNKCKHEPLKKEASPCFYFYPFVVMPMFYALMFPYHTIPSFFLILNALNLARQLRVQIAKPV